MSESPKNIWMKSFEGSAWIGDLVLIICGIIVLLSGQQPFEISRIDSKDAIVQFLLVITIIPWYGGYLLHHFHNE